MESLADGMKGNIDHKNLEYSHEFLRGYTDIYTITFMLQKVMLIITSVI